MADEADESLANPLFTSPDIKKPAKSSTVSPGFLIEAVGGVGVSKWRVEFWQQGRLLATRHPGFSGFISSISFNVPTSLIPAGQFHFEIDYRVGLIWSAAAYSGDMTMRGQPAKPVIKVPSRGAVIWRSRPEVSGTGEPGAKVELYQARAGTVLFGSADVDNDGNWKIPALHADLWMADPFEFTANQTRSGWVSGWSDTVPTTVIFKPIIENVTTGVMPTVTGKGGFPDAKLEIWIEDGVDGAQMETRVRSDGTWTAEARWPWAAATHTITAIQYGPVSGHESDWAEPKTFTIEPPVPKPPPPVVTQPKGESNLEPGSLSIMGTCTAGATVTLLNIDDSFLADAHVYGTSWTYSRGWDYGFKHVRAVQTLNGTASDSFKVNFYIKPPQSPITEPAPDSRHAPGSLTLKGTCVAGATVELRNYDNSFLARVAVVGTGWSYTRPWDIGYKHVRAVQTVRGASSDHSMLDFYIKPPQPAIDHPDHNSRHEPGTVVIEGTCLAGAEVKLLNHDDSWLADAVVVGTTWTYCREWDIGYKQVKVRQSFKDAFSDITVGRDFFINPPLPVCTYPEQDARFPVGQLIIEGTCMAGATVELFNYDDSWLADAVVVGTKWTYSRTWTIGYKQIKVRQCFKNALSGITEGRDFFIKPPLPVCTYPEQDARFPAGQLIIEGTCMAGATVKLLNHDDSWLADAVVNDTKWRSSRVWDIGYKQVKVQQCFKDVLSDITEGRDFHIKPLQAVITDPGGALEPLGTLSLKGVNVYATQLVMRIAGTTTEVAGNFAGSGSTRTFTPQSAWKYGSHSVTATQIVKTVESDPSAPCTFTVRPVAPSITVPSGPVEPRGSLSITQVHAEATRLVMRLAGTTTEITGTFMGSGTTRTFAPTSAWPVGNNSVRVTQFVSEVESASSAQCDFVVETSLTPPVIDSPAADSESSSSPEMCVIGTEPYADVTVRHVDGEALFHGPADDKGECRFVVKQHLPLGDQFLEVMQEFNGTESGWSDPHTFTVKRTPVSPPNIERPSQNANMGTLWFSGGGVDHALVTLRIKQDGNEIENGTEWVTGSNRWNWRPRDFSLEPGAYTVEAKQGRDGQESGWTVPARGFNAVPALFGIGEAGPVIAQPVVASGESVLLRARVVSAESGAGVEGAEVVWHVDGAAVLATTTTGFDGWAHYRFTPSESGEYIVIADLTEQNDGVVVAELFEVTALPHNAWEREFVLSLNGVPVDLATADIVLQPGQSYEWMLEVRDDSPLIGLTSVALENVVGAEAPGLTFEPLLETPLPIGTDPLRWSMTVDTDTSAYAGLKLTSPKLPDRPLPVQVRSRDLAHDVDVRFDRFVMAFGGKTAYPCHGTTHTFTIKPKADSPLLGCDVKLNWLGDAIEGVEVSPRIEELQRLGPDGFTWTLSCVDSVQNGSFSLQLEVPEPGISSLALNMSLGHNKVNVIDRDGPREVGGTGDRWRTGICVASEFTGNVVAVPVTVYPPGNDPYTGITDIRGWIYVYHAAEQSVGFMPHNPYDHQD
jgi:hypothetical protein